MPSEWKPRSRRCGRGRTSARADSRRCGRNGCLARPLPVGTLVVDAAGDNLGPRRRHRSFQRPPCKTIPRPIWMRGRQRRKRNWNQTPGSIAPAELCRCRSNARCRLSRRAARRRMIHLPGTAHETLDADGAGGPGAVAGGRRESPDFTAPRGAPAARCADARRPRPADDAWPGARRTSSVLVFADWTCRALCGTTLGQARWRCRRPAEPGAGLHIPGYRHRSPGRPEQAAAMKAVHLADAPQLEAASHFLSGDAATTASGDGCGWLPCRVSAGAGPVLTSRGAAAGGAGREADSACCRASCWTRQRCGLR